jgi:hypothetical protein
MAFDLECRYLFRYTPVNHTKGIAMRTAIIASTLLAVVVAADAASGNGRGKGLGRALSQVGKASAPGLNKAGSTLSRSTPAMNRANGLQRAPGLLKAPGGKTVGGSQAADAVAANLAKDPALQHQRQLQIEQRNRDHRLAQALKLRALGEKNGDAELLANADRMEAQANQHYADRVNKLGRFGVIDPSLTAPTNVPGGTEGVSVSSPENRDVNINLPADMPSEAPRSAIGNSWKPKWWGSR